MMIDREAKRIHAIKLRYVFTEHQCSCCGNYFRKEKMYKVHVWGVNRSVVPLDFCQNCMKSREEVLEEVDSYQGFFGIAFVDDF